MSEGEDRVDPVKKWLLIGIAVAVVWVTLLWSPQGWLRWELFGLGVTAAVIMLSFLLGPAARWLVGEREGFTPHERKELTVAERVEAVSHARQALMQAVTGLVVIVGVVFTAGGLVYTSKTLQTTQEGQVTDRYTKAIEQLGSPKPEVRLGGIYALERLMRDSSRDQFTIVEVLASYVRVHAQDPPPTGSDKTRLAVDVQAAFTVIGRRDRTRDYLVLDLTAVDLHDKNLAGLNLQSANLTAAILTGARLTNAEHLRGANLSGADLRDITGLTPNQIRKVAHTDHKTKF